MGDPRATYSLEGEIALIRLSRPRKRTKAGARA